MKPNEKGVSESVALVGSNVAQYMSTGRPDDPRDSAAISVGFSRTNLSGRGTMTGSGFINLNGLFSTDGFGAGGGFVLYPNKINGSAIQSVYAKGH